MPHLDVGDGHRLCFEVHGRADGVPAVVLHGGPGSGCTEGHLSFFDLDRYRVVLLDQRGCGRSTPHAGDTLGALAANTTDHLVDDLERLRTHLGIDRWLVWGSSWGSVLAQAYALAHPARVRAAVLVAVATGARSEIDWLYHGLGPTFPEAFADLRAGVPEGADVVEAYRAWLASPDPAVVDRAAAAWCRWENAIVSAEPLARYDDPRFRRGFARVVTHYMAAGCFVPPEGFVPRAGALAGIPAVLVHGAADLTGPLAGPRALAAAWPGAELVVVGDAGHLASDVAMWSAARSASDRLVSAP